MRAFFVFIALFITFVFSITHIEKKDPQPAPLPWPPAKTAIV